MGLDSVEIVLRIEEEFGLHLPDTELASVETVGDLYRVVLAHLEPRPSCLTSRAFHRLRRALMDQLKIPRKSIRPATKLASLLPRSTRIANWKLLAVATCLDFPRLRHPRWARDLIRIATAIAATSALVKMIDLTHPDGLLWIPPLLVATFAGLVAFHGLYALTSYLAGEFPVRTIGELATLLLTTNFESFGPDTVSQNVLSTEDVWRRMVSIFTDQMQLDPSEVVPTARIAEDLHIS